MHSRHKIRNLSRQLTERAIDLQGKFDGGINGIDQIGRARGGPIPGYQEGGPPNPFALKNLRRTDLINRMDKLRDLRQPPPRATGLRPPFARGRLQGIGSLFRKLVQGAGARDLSNLDEHEQAFEKVLQEAERRGYWKKWRREERLRKASKWFSKSKKKGIGSILRKLGKFVPGAGAVVALGAGMFPEETGPGTLEEFEKYERRRHERDEDREEHELMPGPFSDDLRLDQTIKDLIEKMKEGGLEGLLSPQPEEPLLSPEEIPIPQTMMATGGAIPGYQAGGRTTSADMWNMLTPEQQQEIRDYQTGRGGRIARGEDYESSKVSPMMWGFLDEEQRQEIRDIQTGRGRDILEELKEEWLDPRSIEELLSPPDPPFFPQLPQAYGGGLIPGYQAGGQSGGGWGGDQPTLPTIPEKRPPSGFGSQAPGGGGGWGGGMNQPMGGPPGGSLSRPFGREDIPPPAPPGGTGGGGWGQAPPIAPPGQQFNQQVGQISAFGGAPITYSPEVLARQKEARDRELQPQQWTGLAGAPGGPPITPEMREMIAGEGERRRAHGRAQMIGSGLLPRTPGGQSVTLPQPPGSYVPSGPTGGQAQNGLQGLLGGLSGQPPRDPRFGPGTPASAAGTGSRSDPFLNDPAGLAQYRQEQAQQPASPGAQIAGPPGAQYYNPTQFGPGYQATPLPEDYGAPAQYAGFGAPGEMRVRQEFVAPELAAPTAALTQSIMDIGTTPYEQYQGPRLAGFSPDEAAAQAAFGAYGRGQGPMGTRQAAGTLGEVGRGLGSMAGRAEAGALDPYMSQYMAGVVDPQLRKLQEFSRQQGEELKSRAAGATGGIGGLREGVLRRGQLQDVRQQAADVIGQGQQRAFESAQQAFGKAHAERLSQLGQLSGVAGQQRGLGEQQQQQQLARLQQMQQAGATQRQLQQAGLDVGWEEFQRRQQYPQKQTSWMAQQLAALPYQNIVQSAAYAQQAGPGATAISSGIGALGAHEQYKAQQEYQEMMRAQRKLIEQQQAAGTTGSAGTGGSTAYDPNSYNPRAGALYPRSQGAGSTAYNPNSPRAGSTGFRGEDII